MRLWHYELIPYLPDLQLKAQWRELNAIFSPKSNTNHILINYIYEHVYWQNKLLDYSVLVINEMNKRKIKIRKWSHFYNFHDNNPNSMRYHNYFLTGLEFRKVLNQRELEASVYNYFSEHDDRYLLQCFYNLQEKYDRGQKDFSETDYLVLYEFVKQRLPHYANIIEK